MALRRVLPSRSTPDKAPESAATPAPKPKEERAPKSQTPEFVAPSAPPAESFSAPAWESSAVAAAASSAFSDFSEPKPEPKVEPQAESTPAPWEASAIQDEPVAAPVTEAAAPARSLEDSFSKPAQTLDETPAPAFVAPAWDAPASDTFVASAWDAPAEPAPVAVAVPEPEITPAPAVEAVPEAITPEVAIVAPAVMAAPMPQAEPVSPFLPEPQPESFSAPAFESTPEEVAPQPEFRSEPHAESSEPAPQPETATEAVPQGPTTFDFQPSRPDSAPIKRRVREKRPRDLSAMGSAPDAQQERPKPMTAFAPTVPVDTKPLDQVDESLIASGVLAPRPVDSLTGGLPVGLAESESPVPQPRTFTEPEPALAAPVVLEIPATVAAPDIAPAPLPEPKIEFQPQPEVMPAPQPAPVIIQPEPVSTHMEINVAAAAQPAAPTISLAIPSLPVNEPAPQSTSYTLSSAAVQAPAAAPLPQPQSDLPWTQPQTSVEWDIGTPDNTSWGAGMAEESAPASHMPPPASDLYKPISAHPASQTPPTLPPRTMATFTPELPGQRNKSAGAPWAFVAVGALVVIGAGAYFMTSGGSSKVQQQLANLTHPQQQSQQVAGTDGLLPPPAENGGSSFVAAIPPASEVSSNAIVNFADVPADQANQPIVASGTEEMPEDMSLSAQFMNEIGKARARKEGQPLDPSATAAPTETAATGDSPDQIRAKLQEEMAAYRNALSQTSNPGDLKPATFRANPQNRMEGTATAEAAQGAEGSLLPPPAASGGGATPPAELYTNNPRNLPVVAEPLANAPSRVRTLADFPDVEPYMPEREKVEIPKNLKPKMAATDFPALEVLSFVPGKGIVAFADGREGVLLIGESLNGWELVNVTPDNAEFKAGQKNYQVTAEN